MEENVRAQREAQKQVGDLIFLDHADFLKLALVNARMNAPSLQKRSTISQSAVWLYSYLAEPGVALPNSSASSCKSLLLVFAVVCALPLIAGNPQETHRPKYDLSTESKMKATVQEVKLPAKGSEKEIAHLLVKVGTDTFDVYLCPKAFLDDMGVNFSQGEEIVLTGSRIKQGEAEVILAREIVMGTDTLVLRDEKGKPVWG